MVAHMDGTSAIMETGRSKSKITGEPMIALLPKQEGGMATSEMRR